MGLSTRSPGAGDAPESTWDFLINGGDAIRELPEGLWGWRSTCVASTVMRGATSNQYLNGVQARGRLPWHD
ncbi:beta-ketoacyl synthase N-terminal-like domain-containing protein [Nocardia sp. NPDC004123]